MSNPLYIDLKKISDTSVESMIVRDEDSPVNLRSNTLMSNPMLCLGSMLFAVFMGVLIYVNFFAY